jgi:primosomal protein N' (replication factor Y) (superfamily II helicase)
VDHSRRCRDRVNRGTRNHRCCNQHHLSLILSSIRPTASADRFVRVLPDEAAIGKAFDYLVPATMAGAELIAVGTEVRVELNGRRIGGWVVAVDVQPPVGVTVRSIAKVRGIGAPSPVVDLALWAAWRWGGRSAQVLRFTNPPVAIRRLPTRPMMPTISIPANDPLAIIGQNALVKTAVRGGPIVVRTPPATDRFGLILTAISHGGSSGTLIVTPSLVTASVLARRLRRMAIPVALLPDDWALAAAGGCVVIGARAAAFAPIPDPGCILVLDEHDEALQDERSPTWHARDVAIERARRLNIPCVLTSPTPTLEALAASPHDAWTVDRKTERTGWSRVIVIDRTTEEPGKQGLISKQLVHHLRTDERVLCILNRTGRARMLGCVACGIVATCESCGAAVHQPTEITQLICPRCTATRPIVCTHCGGGRMKNLRMGTSRAREELEALAQRAVGEVTAETTSIPDTPVLVGTEALLHRVDKATTVAFLDLDGELLAPRHRASEHALVLLARAARIVSGRTKSTSSTELHGVVLIQTRQPEHPAIQAALLGDPSRVNENELAIRHALRLPPVFSLAVISGESAPIWADRLRATSRIDVNGPADGRYLVRAQTIDALAEALAEINSTRPPGRVRVEVDPLRI